MKEFLIYFFSWGDEPEFALFTFAHFAPILCMLAVIFLMRRFRTRDPRMNERKKYGLKAARRAPQFSKR